MNTASSALRLNTYSNSVEILHVPVLYVARFEREVRKSNYRIIPGGTGLLIDVIVRSKTDFSMPTWNVGCGCEH